MLRNMYVASLSHLSLYFLRAWPKTSSAKMSASISHDDTSLFYPRPSNTGRVTLTRFDADISPALLYDILSNCHTSRCLLIRELLRGSGA
ncbi:hypothetical protein F4818DRAFT_406115 [Hypoxylon cercidicola]|nr:hypothetical protein F4818DRAFT_406115 [Hypoxylon cercidicola]